jgi:hypothetical protein
VNESNEVKANASPELFQAVEAEVVDSGKSEGIEPQLEETSQSETAVMVQEPRAVSADPLLEKILDKGNIEVLERYLKMRADEEARQAKIRFDEEFAKMRAKLPAIKKSKKALDGKTEMYSYAPIETLQSACDQFIHAAGFSYSWREEAIENGKRVYMDVTGFGHTRTNYFDAPTIPGTKWQNAIQVAGALSSYGRRYTFISGFGLVVEGEDDDAEILSFQDGVMYAEQVLALQSCASIEDLAKVFKIEWDKLGTDQIGRDIIHKVKNEMKSKLTKQWSAK